MDNTQKMQGKAQFSRRAGLMMIAGLFLLVIALINPVVHGEPISGVALLLGLLGGGLLIGGLVAPKD